MKYIQCPTEADLHSLESTLFLAGGISNCPDWQSELTVKLESSNWTVLNPRRTDFDAGNSRLAKSQIDWEFRHLRLASAIAFWFPSETLCPITLFELGAWSMTDKPLFIGVDPKYQRRLDVKIQTQLARPEVVILESLTDLAVALQGGIS
jgi:Nucleoside 2-deoxyribosyltransferase like